MQEKIKVKSLYRVGIVVEDAAKKVEILCKYFNIDEKSIVVVDDTDAAPVPEDEQCKYYGNPCDFKLKVMVVPLPNIELEFIQPLDDKGPYADFLKNHGEGVQHFNIAVENCDAFNSLMKEKHVPILTEGSMPTENIKWNYYEATDLFGLIFELVEEM